MLTAGDREERSHRVLTHFQLLQIVQFQRQLEKAK